MADLPNGPLDLTRLLETLDAQAPQAQRHLWLITLLAWVRAGMGHTMPRPRCPSAPN